MEKKDIKTLLEELDNKILVFQTYFWEKYNINYKKGDDFNLSKWVSVYISTANKDYLLCAGWLEWVLTEGKLESHINNFMYEQGQRDYIEWIEEKKKLNESFNEENTSLNATKYHEIYKWDNSIDLYNIILNIPNIERWKRRMILGILKDRKEDDLIYSISINI